MKINIYFRYFERILNIVRFSLIIIQIFIYNIIKYFIFSFLLDVKKIEYELYQHINYVNNLTNNLSKCRWLLKLLLSALRLLRINFLH